MRGQVEKQSRLFWTVDLEEIVPSDHPLRRVKVLCEEIFGQMRKDFNAAYSRTGRPGIPPEQLLKALLLQALYSIPSEIKLTESIRYNMLFRWFLDLGLEREVWTPESFSMNRCRFERYQLFRKFFDRIVSHALEGGWISEDHFTVDGTLIRSWASLKSLEPRDGSGGKVDDDDRGNPTVDFHKEKRRNETHGSRTDPEARLARKGKGKEAHLCHSGHLLMENRNGLCLDVQTDAADGQAERRRAKAMLKHVKRRHGLKPKTMGADAGYDDGRFLRELEDEGIIPHVPLKRDRVVAEDPAGQARRRAKQRRKTKGYQLSQRIRKRVEEIFGWFKTVGTLARTRFVGRWKIGQEGLITGAAYNLLRLVRLEATG